METACPIIVSPLRNIPYVEWSNFLATAMSACKRAFFRARRLLKKAFAWGSQRKTRGQTERSHSECDRSPDQTLVCTCARLSVGFADVPLFAAIGLGSSVPSRIAMLCNVMRLPTATTRAYHTYTYLFTSRLSPGFVVWQPSTIRRGGRRNHIRWCATPGDRADMNHHMIDCKSRSGKAS